MADRLLRHKPTGQLYIHQAAFADHPDFEEVIDVESRVVEEPAPAPAPKKSRAKAGLVETPPAVDDEAISADASRALP